MEDVAGGESGEGVKGGVLNSGFGCPNKWVTINLAPANVRKEGAGFDLPMALGILGAMGVVALPQDHLFIGELSLDGTLRPVRGALSIAVAAQRQGLRNLVVPADNGAEAAIAGGVRVFALKHLAELVAFLQQQDKFQPLARTLGTGAAESGSDLAGLDFKDVRGQTTAKR